MLLWQTQSLRRATPGGHQHPLVGRREDTNRERPWSVPGCSPAPSSVQPKPLIGDDLEQPAAAECIGVGLALNLENVKREEYDFPDPDYTGGDETPSDAITPTENEGRIKPSSSRMHNRFPGTLSERIVELVAVVQAEIVADERLATILVDPLQNLFSPALVTSLVLVHSPLYTL